jgi:transcription elongation factor GreA
MLRNAEVIDEEELSTDTVSVGSTVRLFDEVYEEEVVYTILGSTEADPFNMRISNESPGGIALLGRAVGDVIRVEVPDGEAVYKVLAIENDRK